MTTTQPAPPSRPAPTGRGEMATAYDASGVEEALYAWWEECGFFKPSGEGEPFTIVMPPPNLTGELHLGHALEDAITDCLIRWRRMSGDATLWLPGVDHAGIATQAVVERRLLEEQKLSRHDLGREGLIEKIWEWKAQYEKRIIGQLKQIGCSCDWERLRFTLDETCARAVRETFRSKRRESAQRRPAPTRKLVSDGA